jgi:F-box/leucine-rich repeat protein 2/20
MRESFCLLSKCQHIQHLDLQNANFLKDQHVAELSLFLGDLLSINVSCCHKLTQSTLFALTKNCPSLSEIKIESIGSEIVERFDSLIDFGVYRQLKSLYLAHNLWLSDESIIMFASNFPNLQLLDLKSCTNISEEGIIGQVLRRCFKIKHLNLAYCSRVKILRMDFGVSKLEVLNVSNTRVDDEALYVISKNCCGLLQSLLENCSDVTGKGVMNMVENFKQLREISLRNCFRVHSNVIVSMILSRPSLRKINLPCYYRLSGNDHELLSRQGCYVCY